MDEYLVTVWEKIGTTVFSWTCAARRIRADRFFGAIIERTAENPLLSALLKNYE